MMGRRSAPSKCFAHRAKPWRWANSLRSSMKNWGPRHALRVWDGAASQNLGQRRILIKDIKASGVLLLLAAPRRGLFLCVLYFASSIKIPEINRFPGFLARQKGIEPPASPLGGARSILLSYWRIFSLAIQPLYCSPPPENCQRESCPAPFVLC